MNDLIRRAQRAEKTAESQYVKEAIKDIKEVCHSTIESSASDQCELREDMYYLLRAVSSFEKILLKHIREGQTALAGIEETKIKRLKR